MFSSGMNGKAAGVAARAEAAAIWAATFGGSVPERVAERYADALARLPLEANPIDAAGASRSPGRLAAIEFYLRLSRPKNGLSQRFHILFYLAEIEPQLVSRFARQRSSLLLALVDLGRATLMAPAFFVAGRWWWRRSSRA
jgi:hypothetical protein